MPAPSLAHRSSSSLTAITAPYGFVPLSPKVVRPDWLQPKQDERRRPVPPPLHDRPFLDGISGALEIEIEAETPIFTRGTSAPDRFFQLPGDRFAIPSTALRGALRNVVEIATFSRMGRVNDHRYAVRDLHNRELYGNFMAGIVKNPKTGKGEPAPLVNAGWLSRDAAGNHTITVCDFAKIEYEQITAIARERGIFRFDPGEKQSSVRKYETWAGKSLEVKVAVTFWRPETVDGRVMPSRFGKVTSARGTTAGTLVFTGQPARYRKDATRSRRGSGNAKHHDFVFFPPEGGTRRLTVEERVFRDFEFAHSDRGQQNRLGRSETPNEEWGYWRKRLEAGQRVPVFFLADESGREVRAFGLAMMFRLPYRNSIGDTLGRVHPPVEGALDFAEGLFGTVSESDRRAASFALQGRVAFSHAVAESARELARVEVVLGAPKASYYPNYVEQDPDVPGAQPPRSGSGSRYTTWQDDFARPRGWKRYRPMTRTWKPQPPTGADGRPLDIKKVGTAFRPLAAGTRFRSTVTVHNLRPVELGALLWALDFGGDRDARHTLGMARPLGYGRCRITVTGADLRGIDGTAVDLDAARARFREYMESQVPGWSSSIQIEALLNLARPVDPDAARYQRLDPGRGTNEFVDAKRAFLVLPAAHRVTGKATLRVAGGGERRDEAPRFARGGGRSPAASRQPAPASSRPAVSPARAGWPGKRRGEALQVRLEQLNKKGKWRARAVEYDAVGTIEGNAPPDAAAGKEYTVEILEGGDPRKLNLKWKEQ